VTWRMGTQTCWPWPGGSPAGGAWLWVTTAEARRGGEFTAVFLPRRRPTACGGDVLVRIAPREQGAGDTGPATAVAGVQVWAVAAGSLVRVAGWDLDSLDLWPEIVRSPVVFALGALRELQDHGADAGSRDEVDLIAAAGSVPTPFPALPARVNLRG
jgi:hypothetical protein